MNKTSLIFISFKKTLDSLSVLKTISFNFGFYFFGVSFLVLFLFSLMVSKEYLGFLSAFLSPSLLFLSHAFTVFIIPYYAYKKLYDSPAPDFWEFISKTVFPLIIAHIKAFLVIFLFCLLLIIPGIYKAIRFSFLSQTVFFDSNRSHSPLKTADQLTRGFFWPIVLYLIIALCFSSILYSFNKLLFSNLPFFLKSSLNLVISFYISCFFILWKNLFYFEIKKFKEESISL